jgi:hypothetical protein
VWLKQLGPWSDADIAERLIPCYPEVCLMLEFACFHPYLE